jgi:hypothetical protein
MKTETKKDEREIILRNHFMPPVLCTFMFVFFRFLGFVTEENSLREEV